MKLFSVLLAASSLILISPVAAQRVAVVRGIGTQTCKSLVAANQTEKQFSLQAAQWILGNLTGYFRQAGDDPSRTLADDVLVKTVLDVCASNAEKTIDDALAIAISSLPTTEVAKPAPK